MFLEDMNKIHLVKQGGFLSCGKISSLQLSIKGNCKNETIGDTSY